MATVWRAGDREISDEEFTRGSPVVVNETFAKFFFPDRNPIGIHLTDAYPTRRVTFEIVGVVTDIRDHYLQGEHEPRFYANLAGPIGSVHAISLVLRTNREPGSVMPAIRPDFKADGSSLAIRNSHGSGAA